MNKGGGLYLPFRNFVHLTQEEAYDLMSNMLSGEMETESIIQVLQYLRQKGETVAELVGFAKAMRDLNEATPLDQQDEPLLDNCGTGGDSAQTFNISTATAFVAAGAGLRVAKHGNRRISSECGSADVLERLGIPPTLSVEQAAECIRQTGIGFLYAPAVYPGLAHVREARLSLKGKTIFNLLGPLTNPLRADIQLIGAFSVRASEMLALAALRLGVERAFVVHGSDGLDEITTTGLTTVFQVEAQRIQKGQWNPVDFGMLPSSIDELRGCDADTNAGIIQAILNGETGPKRDIVVMNAAAALLLARKAEDLKNAVAMAVDSIESGSARRKLEQVVTAAREFTHESV